jgi:alpha-tubulin suppressor-like RCC1 family protein
MPNAGKWSTRLVGTLLRMVTVLVLAIASIPAAPLSEASASPSPSPSVIPAIAVVAAPSQPTVTQIVPGWEHTCAITPAGGVICWGANYAGQLGDGTTDGRSVPVAVSGLSSGVVSLALGGLETCALTAFGRVYCWGVPSDGRNSPVPLEVTGLGNQVVQLVAGNAHTCALTSSGKVLCWGYNYFGQLGNASFTDSPTPVLAIAANAAQISTGMYTSCAVMTSGRVQCWGDGRDGQLGDGVVAPPLQFHSSNVPVQVLAVGGSPLTGATQVGLGERFGCALIGSGVHCWGDNAFGQLGNGTAIARPFAGPVLNAPGDASLGDADQLSTGDVFACVHLASNELRCWGDNEAGQSGNNEGGLGITSPFPVTVLNPAGTAPLQGAVWVATGQRHTCTFINWEAEYPFYCWGNNNMGQLGIGTVTLIESLPRPVAYRGALIDAGSGGGGLGQEKQIVAGGAHTCSFTSGGGLKCWGANSYGQLGDGTTADSLDPVDVPGMGSDVKSMALGQNFTCALLPLGRLKCWGDNTHGQLGAGSTISSSLPAFAILPDVAVRKVAAGDSHVCVLTPAGSVLCWGDNTYGQLGDGTVLERTAPVQAIASGAAGIGLGGSTSCAVMSTGEVKCWGLGDMGQLGDGLSGAGHRQLTGQTVKVVGGGSLTGTTQVALGSNYGCALLEGGLVDCWGKNDAGQLGRGVTSPLSAFAVPVVTALGGSPLQGATQVTAGGGHACVRMYTNRLKCWGLGVAGQLGVGTSGVGVHSALPNTVLDHYAPAWQGIPYLEVVSQVSAGGAHTCAFLKWNGSNPYRCWGDNSRGQLGDGSGTGSGQLGVRSLPNRPYPNTVWDPLNFGSAPLAKIAAGYGHSCALNGAGGVRCWGDNFRGQLGDGTNTNSDIPAAVVGLSSGVIGLVAGDNHTCALTAAGGIKCWGYNTHGQLGDATSTQHNTPVDVSGLSSGVIGLAAGGAHTCALTSAGGVKCWGKNFSGQLGDDTITNRDTPVNVAGLSSGVIGLAAGAFHSCALTSVGGVMCWGDFGGLGGPSKTPVNVSGLSSGVIELVAGSGHTCALTSGGGVKCWGSNSTGQLGDGTTTSRGTPELVTGLTSGAIGLAAGDVHTCALTSESGVKCWGDNTFGQLGDGTNTFRFSPVAVSGLPGSVTLLTAGASHTCAVLAGTGPLRCWGDNSYGQLGIPVDDMTDTKGPVVSRWLTANGLVDDEKPAIINLPHPNMPLVIPAQPLTATALVTASEVISSSVPPPCTNCVVPPGVPAVTVSVSSHVILHVHWVIHFPKPWPSNSLQSAAVVDEAALNLYHYVDGSWIPMLPCTGCSLDTTNHVLTASLDGEGIYALMAGPRRYVYLPLVMRSQ